MFTYQVSDVVITKPEARELGVLHSDTKGHADCLRTLVADDWGRGWRVESGGWRVERGGLEGWRVGGSEGRGWRVERVGLESWRVDETIDRFEARSCVVYSSAPALTVFGQIELAQLGARDLKSLGQRRRTLRFDVVALANRREGGWC